MARPLPKDVEDSIASLARRSEVRSVAVMAFILGIAVGVGIGSSFIAAGSSGSFNFLIGAGVVAALWLFAARRRKQQ